MMHRVIFSAAFVIHGMMHLIVFIKAWAEQYEIVTVNALAMLPAGTLRYISTLWAISGVLLLASAYAFFRQKDWFPSMASLALLISLASIILYWDGAKWGTPINVVLFAVVALVAARNNFDKQVKEEQRFLISLSTNPHVTINENQVSALPKVVQDWLHKTQVVGQSRPLSVYVKQNGYMRMEAQEEWMPFDAEQHFTLQLLEFSHLQWAYR